MEAIKGKEAVEGKDEFEIVDALSSLAAVPVPKAVEEIRTAPIRHNLECDVDGMKDMVKGILNI